MKNNEELNYKDIEKEITSIIAQISDVPLRRNYMMHQLETLKELHHMAIKEYDRLLDNIEDYAPDDVTFTYNSDTTPYVVIE